MANREQLFEVLLPLDIDKGGSAASVTTFLPLELVVPILRRHPPL